MNSTEIWIAANQRKDLIQSICQAISGRKKIAPMMDQLKAEIPCLFGVDDEKCALVFRSTDEGLVAIYLKQDDDLFVLAMTTGIQLT